MSQWGGSTSTYQSQYDSDKTALNAATTNDAFQNALNTLNDHISAIQLPALKTEAYGMQSKLESDADSFGKAHTYYDSYNGTTYNYAYEYGANGIATSYGQSALDNASTIDGYKSAVSQFQTWLENFDAYKTNFSDGTAWNQVHQTDLSLMKYYGETPGKTIIISLAEQVMRVYQDGNLVYAFQIVSGQPGHASLPGNWYVQTKQTNIEFTSGKSPGQDGYYPPTPIPMAMQYHGDGYFMHTAWWRSVWGTHMQFPHNDPDGDSFAYTGSHGCVNMSASDITTLFNWTTTGNTGVVIY
jgi:lipoprotein-anchoring transpeptidase ErfK/SrfK